MNKGLIPGLNPDGWREYNPQLRCAGAGGETQPFIPEFTVPNIPFGRYNAIDKSLVLVEAQMAFVGAFVIGAGTAYVLSLPFPANRWSGRGSAPIPLGVGMCYFSFLPSPNVNMPVIVTLADPFASLAGQEDSYVQAYCPYILSWGSASLASGTATVTHRCGYAPRAEDIDLTFTTIAPGNRVIAVQNITSTTFDVISVGGSNAAEFSWKIRGKPPTGSTGAVMSPTVPWDWSRGSGSGPFGNIFIQLAYEPRR